MRIAVISDIHANATALKAVIKHIKEQSIDEIIFLGDLVMNGPHPKETLEIMKRISPLVWIKGNTDSWFNEIEINFIPRGENEKRMYSIFRYANNHLTPQDIELLLSKADNQNIEIAGVNILCVHGSNLSDMEQLGVMTPIETFEKITNEIGADVLLCGHSHLPYYASFNGKKIINVGAVSLSMDEEPLASYGVLDIDQRVISYTNYKVPYDIQQVLMDATRGKLPNLDVYTRRLTTAK